MKRSNWRERAWLASTWPGRIELRRRHGGRLWRITRPIARLYRATIVRRVRVVTVVGSIGKTTTTRAVAAALGVSVHRQALFNANSFSAVDEAVFRIRPWQRRAVLEVGIGAPGQMHVYGATVRPDIVVVTAVASDHWKSMPSLEVTRHEKAMMVRALPDGGTAVLNADDPNVRWMAGQTRARVVLFGCAPEADVRASDINIEWPHGTSFTLLAAGASRRVRVRLVGRHMVYAALAAVAVALVEGLSLDDAVAALAELAPTPGRMQPLPLPSGAVMLHDDFKATAATFAGALDTLAAIPARRRIVVFGEMDEPPPKEHVAYRELGARVAAVADRAIFVGDKFRRYRPGATAGGLGPEQLAKADTAHDVIELLRDELGPGDVVLLKGRWQQRLARVGLALAGRPVACRADPCPFKRMLCELCPFLEQPFAGRPVQPLGSTATVTSGVRPG